MNERTLLGAGIAGSVIAALCCFTPLLVVGLGIVGLSAAVGWVDFVLFPTLAFFIGLTIYAVHRRQKVGHPFFRRVAIIPSHLQPVSPDYFP